MSGEENINTTNEDIIDKSNENGEINFKEGKDKIQLTIKTKRSVDFSLPEDQKEHGDKNINEMKKEPTIHDLSLYIDESQLNSAFSLYTPAEEKRSPLSAIFGPKVPENSIYEVTFPIPEENLVKDSNYIRTTKYTIWSFLPLNLLSQVIY